MPGGRRPSRRLINLLPLSGLLLQACTTGMPDGATRQGRQIHDVYVIILILALIVFFGVEFVIVWSVIRYRRHPGDDEMPKQIHGNTILEAVWFAIPSVIVAILFVVSLQTIDKVDAKEAAPSVRIEVTGFQWQWRFKYVAEEVVVRGSTAEPPEMVVPVEEPIRVTLKAADVIHSFYVRAFNFKRDLIPGRTNEFDFVAEETGTFDGQCAEFCGLLHNKMTFTVRVVERSEFEQWVLDQKEAERKRLEACGAPQDRVAIVAKGIAFDKFCIALPAGKDYEIEFDNQDANVAHNVAIYKTEAADPKDVLLPGQIFNGIAKRTYEATAPEAGDYFFRCDVHPIMSGTVIVR